MSNPTISFTGNATDLLANYKKLEDAQRKELELIKAAKDAYKTAAQEERQQTADATKLKEANLSALEKHNRAVAKAGELLKANKITQAEYNAELKRQASLLEEGKSNAAGMALEGVKAVTGIGSAMAAVGAIVSTIKAEVEEMRARDERARQSQLSFGQVMRDLATGFTPDATLGRGDLQPAVERISRQSGSSPATAAIALSEALAGRGSLSASSAVDIATAAAAMNPGNLEDTREMAFRGAQLQDSLGLQDPRQALGLISQVKNIATVAKLRDVGQTAVPSILSLGTYGDTPEQAAELFSAINNQLNDKEGSRTRTAVSQMALQLSEKMPTLGSTSERLAAVQADPGKFDKFIDDMNFDSDTKAMMRQFLRGSPGAMRKLATARAGITAPESATGDYEAMIAETLSNSSVRLADVEARTAANLEFKKIADTAGGAAAQAEATISRDQEQTAFGAPQWMVRGASGLTRLAGRLMGASQESINAQSAIAAPLAAEFMFQNAMTIPLGGTVSPSQVASGLDVGYTIQQLNELKKISSSISGPPENALGRPAR